MSDEFKMFDDDEEIVEEPTMTLPAVGGVRITGATPANDDLLADWQLYEPVEAADIDLPHWTDEPTGQVPTVLDRETGEANRDPLSEVEAPMWREDASDWSNDSDAFESLISAPVEGPTGALSADPGLEESQPWEFDLDDIPLSQSAESDREPELFSSTLGADAEPSNPWDLDDLPLLPPVPAAAPAPRRRGGNSRSEARGAEPQGTDRVEDDSQGSDRPLRRSGEERRVPTRHDDGGQGRTGRDLPVAVITGVLIAVLVLVTFNIGTFLAMILVIAVVTLAAAEVFAAFRRNGEHPATLLGLVATIALLIATYNKGTQAVGLVTVLLFVFTVIWYMAGVEKTDALRGLASTMLVFVWIGVFGSYAALLLNPNLFPSRHGLAFLLGAILVSVIYDVAALFVGSAVGKRPMAPNVSPNKTWEGLAGGTAAALLMGVIVVPMIHPWTLSSAFTLGIVVSIVSPLGDLAESLMKRTLGVKDMGRLLPGHGGLLDRVDGLLFVLPATFYLVEAFHLS